MKNIPGLDKIELKIYLTLEKNLRENHFVFRDGMEKVNQEKVDSSLPPVSNTEAALRHFRIALDSGKHWYLALLEAIGLWTDEVENIQGRDYCYLIEGEAFDWLLLAARICETVEEKIPDGKKYALLFKSRPPLALSNEEFKNLIGESKFHKYLNYFYGVTVEEALVQAVREEVRKERTANCWPTHIGEEDDVFTRVYGDSQTAMFKQFRREKHFHLAASSNVAEMRQFTYWCFKHRVRTCEKARVASDTHKALEWLHKNGYQ
jgi:hypothetical protein